jgi:hypothetical protein
MRRNLLQVLSGKCRHEFAWPRKTEQGDYYQVCLICGDEYQYDWPSMRRLGRRGESIPVRTTHLSANGASKRGWTPRARRLKSPIPVRFRTQGETDLHPGTIENVSQSGLFLRAEQCPSPNEVLEMVFQMPVEISGQENAEVLCMGQVVRIAPPTGGVEVANGFAVTILDYHFLHGDARKKPIGVPQNLDKARHNDC